MGRTTASSLPLWPHIYPLFYTWANLSIEGVSNMYFYESHSWYFYLSQTHELFHG